MGFVLVDGDHSWEGIEADWAGRNPLVGRGIMSSERE
jgi:hypothetical protein